MPNIEGDPFANHTLPGFVEAFAPLEIIRFEEQGGPFEDDFRRAREFGTLLGEKGDILLFGSGKASKTTGVAGHMAVEMVHAVAVLAFCPGGITLFGFHFEGERKEEAQSSEVAP
jgi:hypothetical protein